MSLQLYNQVLSLGILQLTNWSTYIILFVRIDEGKEIRAIFCDISKAFDRVWHKRLLYKLETAGISGSLLS